MMATSNNNKTLGIALVGLGTVGTGVYKLLANHPQITLKGIALKDTSKTRGVIPHCTVHTDPFFWENDSEIDLVIEVIGGTTTAKSVIEKALAKGKHVVTANKALLAEFGPALFAQAKENNVRILFEGAVAGGIPILLPLKQSLAANQIQAMAGIVNGTTNYILTKMTQAGLGYAEALKQAQDLGFAEADPTSDVEGLDARAKIALLATLAYQKTIDLEQIHCQGISTITALDIQEAEALGYVIKLIGWVAKPNSTEDSLDIALDIRIHPMLVPKIHPLAAIHNEFNAVWVKGDAVGDVTFSGRGAGELPTASAVCGDVLSILADWQVGNQILPVMAMNLTGPAQQIPITETTNKYYIRLETSDLPGVIGNLGKACGEFGVSLESVLQRNTHQDGSATIVLVTHQVQEKQMKQALQRIESQETTKEVACLLRVLSA
jgi:homoserine dehydrogenase